ncbi:MAG: cupin domain-containing protein [Planctomycetaceae bacterium]
MAIKHATPGEVVDINPLGHRLKVERTHTLSKTDDVEIICLVLPAGKDIPTHSAPGQVIVQCIEGRVSFTALGEERELQSGRLLYLPPGEPHAVKAMEDSSLLLTILLPRSS